MGYPRSEAEIIALALEVNADLVLLDEGEAERIVDLHDLPKTGVVGILIRAKLNFGGLRNGTSSV